MEKRERRQRLDRDAAARILAEAQGLSAGAAPRAAAPPTNVPPTSAPAVPAELSAAAVPSAGAAVAGPAAPRGAADTPAIETAAPDKPVTPPPSSQARPSQIPVTQDRAIQAAAARSAPAQEATPQPPVHAAPETALPPAQQPTPQPAAPVAHPAQTSAAPPAQTTGAQATTFTAPWWGISAKQHDRSHLRRNWQGLREVAVDADVLERHLVITAARRDPAHAAFDVLRTKMTQALAERGWKRVAITSPTKGCGKSFTALNLAVAFSRYQMQRTVLLDLDLRRPALARRLGVTAPGGIGDMLRGRVSPAAHLLRFAQNGLHMGPNVAFGLNDRPESYASELFLDPATGEALARIDADFAPDIMLFDMPPALAYDDAIALRGHFDCVLMVVGGGVTTPRDLRAAVQRLGEDMPVLAMVLNRAEGMDISDYSY